MTRYDSIDERLQMFLLFSGILYFLGAAEDHDRAEVEVEVISRTRHHQPVEQRHGQAHVMFVHRSQHPAGGRPVPKNAIALAPLHCRRDVRRVVEAVADVAHWHCIEDGVNRGSIVLREPMVSLNPRSFAWGLFHNFPPFSRQIRHGPVAKRTGSARTIARFGNWLIEPDRRLNLVPVDRQKVHADTLAKRGDAHFCEPRLR